MRNPEARSSPQGWCGPQKRVRSTEGEDTAQRYRNPEARNSPQGWCGPQQYAAKKIAAGELF